MGRAERARYAAAVVTAAAADPAIVARVTAADDRLARPVARESPPCCAPGKLADFEWGRSLLAEGDEALRSAALWAHHEACRTMRPWREGAHSGVCAILARRRLRWTADEVRWAFAVLWAADPYAVRPQQPLLLAAAEAVPAADRPLLHEHVERLQKLEIAAGYGTAEETRRQRRIRALLGIDDAASPTLPPSLLHDGDPYGPAVRAELAELAAPGVVPLLVHCATANGVLPSARWAATAATLLTATSGGPGLVRRLLERLVDHPEWTTEEHWDGAAHTIPHWLHPDTETLLRGVLQVVGALDEPWVDPLLGEVALRAGTGLAGGNQPRAERLASTSVRWIGQRGGPDAVRTLTVLRDRIRQRPLRATITAALDRVAADSGVTVDQLLERSVPDFGLDAAGRREHVLGEHVATLIAAGDVTLGFRSVAGRPLKGVPAAVRRDHAGELAELRTTLKALRATVAAQRNRLEDLLIAGRTWDHADWARHYHDHPVVGLHARALIWELDLGADGWVAGWPAGGGFVDPDGDALPVRPDTGIRLWHPVTAPAERTAAWRRFVTDRELRQPFKQAFREVYLLTPAERSTRVYSNRFAAHVIRAPQAGSLLTARGWRSPHLGYWDGGFDGHATKDLDGWRAEFFYEGIETDGEDYLFSLAGSDQVRFSRAGDGEAVPVELAELPPRVFSEAMRDVDLVVAVASIAADPEWTDHGEARHHDYWHRTTFGALGESAQLRREALARLIPRTRIAERCTLGDRFLTVRGDLRTYKIHLGSANILMEPNDRYLCIVSARDHTSTLYLPFEEGGGLLSVIVSKAFLLASDATITDATILEQIRPR